MLGIVLLEKKLLKMKIIPESWVNNSESIKFKLF